MDWGHLPLVLVKKEHQDAVQQRTPEINMKQLVSED